MKKNNTLRWTIVAIVLVLLAIGVAFAIVKATGVDQTKTIGSTSLSWQIGRLDEDGDLVEDNTVMFTKQHLGIDGLKIQVQKKPSVEVFVGFFNKKGELLNGEMDGDELIPTCYIAASDTETVVWECSEYLATHSEITDAKPVYALVFLTPVRDVEFSSQNLRTYASQVTISYNR